MNQLSHYSDSVCGVGCGDSFDYSCQYEHMLSHDSLADKLAISDNDLSKSKLSVKGNLKKSLSFWKTFCTDEYILSTIEFGYKLPFMDIPPCSFSKNNQSALRYSDFVLESIDELLLAGCVRKVGFVPHVVNPLSVSVQNSGKKRLILDLRKVNLFLAKYKFKMEDLKNVKEVLCKNDFMFTFDLKSGYHHLDIYPEHQTYLGFAWKTGDVLTYYVFTVLPFGLSTAPYIFTKLLIPIKKKWRSEGISNFIFIDDGWVKSESLDSALAVSKRVKDDLSSAGFLPNDEKSVWFPSQSVEWLGTVINSTSGVFSPSLRRIEKILNSIRCLNASSSNRSFHVKAVASLVGQIISLLFCFGNIVRIMTRELYKCIESRSSWFSPILLSDKALAEIVYWKTNVAYFQCKSVWHTSKSEMILYSDASDSGFGGFILQVDNSTVHGQWSDLESRKSSSWRELKAVHNVLLSLKHKLNGKSIKWFTDCQNVVSIVLKGSNVNELHQLALDIFWFCNHNDISLNIEWISRDFNKRADQLSREIDWDDWFVNDYTFHYLNNIWGIHTVDRFANIFNKKLTRFNSKFWNPECEAVDAFTQNWKGENNWVVPPVVLINRVIKHFRECGASGTLIVPFWSSGVFWPNLCPDGIHFAGFVHDVQYFLYGNNVIMKGKSKRSIFGDKNFPLRIFALRISFECSPRIKGICTKSFLNLQCQLCS